MHQEDCIFLRKIISIIRRLSIGNLLFYRTSGLVVLRHGDDYFSFGMSFSKIGESIRHLT
jgi:hypothetical protein